MKYEEKDYLEDLKISKSVFGLYFSRYKKFKDDLIQESVIALWRARSRFNGKKASYASFAYRVSINAMKMLMRKESIHFAIQNFFELGDIEDLSFDIDRVVEIDPCVLIERALRGKKNDVVIKILKLVVQGYSCAEIGRQMHMSRAYVNRLLHEVRSELTYLCQ